jgi:predicted TIM-barrel fold metal-dependent hydrolase
MILDCHVHVSACTPGRGVMSTELQSSFAFKFMRWKFDLVGADDQRTERELANLLIRTIDESRGLVDAAVVLAFDGVYDDGGELDRANTHLYVTNDYVIELARAHPATILFGASVNPYRRDALAELDRCVRGGAVLMKWLPIVQGFDPSDARCESFYEALLHYKLPLLCHTGGEKSLPRVDDSLADPMLLLPALKRGVTVIMAHCGTRSAPFEKDYVQGFMRLAHEYENCYGDTSALCLPTRWHAWKHILNDKVVREKLVHGSDWPIISLPPIGQLGLGGALELMHEKNWMRRDALIKRKLELDDAYWNRAAKLMKLTPAAARPDPIAQRPVSALR